MLKQYDVRILVEVTVCASVCEAVHSGQGWWTEILFRMSFYSSRAAVPTFFAPQTGFM